MNLQLAVVVVLHAACFLLQVEMARWSLGRGRLYAVFFAAAAFYQAVSMMVLAEGLREVGAAVVSQAEFIAFAGTAVLSVIALIGDRFVPARQNRDGKGPVDTIVAHPGLYLSIVGACLTLIVVIMLREGSSFVQRTWQEARLNASYLDSLATLLLFVVVPAAWVAFRSRRAGTGLVLLLASLILFVVYGSRAALLTLPMVVVLEVMVRFGTVRIKPRVMALVVLTALALHVLGRMFRGFGLAGLIALARGESLSGTEWLEVLGSVDLSGGEAAIYRYFLFVVSAAPFLDIAPLTSVVRWIGLYVPGGLLAGIKPVDPTYTVWWHAYAAGVFDSSDSFVELLKVVGAGGGGSLHPLVWGEMWMNGGWLAVPTYAGSLALILLLIEAVYTRVPDVVYVLAAPATLIGYVMVARGNSTIGLGYTAYIVPLALIGYGSIRASLCLVSSYRHSLSGVALRDRRTEQRQSRTRKGGAP